MRKRKPHTIIRLEFPKKYLAEEYRSELNFAISCVAWQHEIGTKSPTFKSLQIGNVNCNPGKILRKVTASRLSQEGLETLEVYE